MIVVDFVVDLIVAVVVLVVVDFVVVLVVVDVVVVVVVVVQVLFVVVFQVLFVLLFELYKCDQVVKAPVRSDSVAPDMTSLLSQGNLFKSIDNKTVKRYVFSNTMLQKKLNINHIWPTLFVKIGFYFKLK